MLDFSVHSLLLALLQGIITKHHTHTTTRETTDVDAGKCCPTYVYSHFSTTSVGF